MYSLYSSSIHVKTTLHSVQKQHRPLIQREYHRTHVKKTYFFRYSTERIANLGLARCSWDYNSYQS